jgi:hypothetical protein
LTSGIVFFGRMKLLRRILLVGLFFTSISSVGFAVDSLHVRKRHAVFGLYAVAYKGSLQNSYARWTPAYQFGMRFRLKKHVNGLLHVSFGRFIGEDRNYKLPSRASIGVAPVSRFESRFFAMGYEAQFRLFQSKGFELFVSQGIGLFRFSVRDWDGNRLLERDRTRERGETYREMTLMLPTRLGMSYQFSNGFLAGIQAGWMNTTTRFLDNMDQLSNNDNRDNLAVFLFQLGYPLR